MSAASFFAVLWMAMPAVVSTSDCPGAEDVTAELAALLPRDAALPGVAVVDGRGPDLNLELHSNDQSYVAQRSVPLSRSCRERAKSAAVMIATWWPFRQKSDVSLDQPARAPVRGGLRVAVGMGGFASAVSGSTAFGARAETAVAPSRLPVAARVSLGFTGAQSRTLGSGKVDWVRVSSEIGPTYRFSAMQVDVGAVLGLFHVEGTGHVINQSTSRFAFGASVGVRASVAVGRISPWLEIRGVYWPQSHRFYVVDSASGGESSINLPRQELQLGLGAAFCLL